MKLVTSGALSHDRWVDHIHQVVDEAPHNSPLIKYPRPYVTDTLMNVLDPLWNDKRNALRQRRAQLGKATEAKEETAEAPEPERVPVEDCYHSLVDAEKQPDGYYTCRRCGTKGLGAGELIPF